MAVAAHGPLLALKADAAKPARTRRTLPRQAEEDGGGVLACGRCLRPVTTTGARIEVAGGHEHTFENPAGFRYHIGCFARAGGCFPVGASSTYWTWFPSYSWQVQQCRTCGEHLGWLFRSSEHVFHGLILDRLVELEEDE